MKNTSSSLSSAQAFAVGALNRERLEDLFADLGLDQDYLDDKSSDTVRAEVLEALEKQGEPSIKITWSPAFWGGNVGMAVHPDPLVAVMQQHSFVPVSLIDALASECAVILTFTKHDIIDIAFTKVTKQDAVHILLVDESKIFSAENKEFIDVAIYGAGVERAARDTGEQGEAASLVKRLRQRYSATLHPLDALHREAADEIERLKGIIPEVMERLNDELCADNTRLAGVVKTANDQSEHFERLWHLAKDDAERYNKVKSDFSAASLDIDGNHSWAYRRNFSLRGPSLDEAIDRRAD